MGKTYDFDKVVDRRKTSCLKYDFGMERKGRDDLLPLWVADMDFQLPEEILADFRSRIDHGIFGYTDPDQEYFDALDHWFFTRHGYHVDRETVTVGCGVVYGLATGVKAFTKEGDAILIQQPVYYPFREVIEDNGRIFINNQLHYENGRYTVDFEDFERKIEENNVKVFLLCNPHNPVGRVYTEEELRRVGEICRRHHVFVIADEIHSDLIFPGHQHIVFASLGQNYAENCAVCHAPSKTFNLAGLSFSCIMIPNEERRKRFDQMFARYCRAHPNFFAPVAAKAAWDHGEAWLDSCLAYIQKNDQFVREFAEDTWNGDVKISPLEGTYLQWIDFRRLEPDAEKLRQKMLYQAHVAMDEGSMFGPEGNGFERLNLAAPRNLIEEIMDRIAAVLR